MILHYEQVVEEESKFEALTSIRLGNTVVENAEIAVIQVDPDLPKPTGRLVAVVTSRRCGPCVQLRVDCKRPVFSTFCPLPE